MQRNIPLKQISTLIPAKLDQPSTSFIGKLKPIQPKSAPHRPVVDSKLLSSLTPTRCQIYPLSIKHALFTPHNSQKRTIFHLSELRDISTSTIEDKVSVTEAVAFHYTGALERFYDFAVSDKQNPSDTARLYLQLFHKLPAGQLRTTQNKSLPAFSLDAILLAKIMHHLSAGTLDTPNVRKDIYNTWRNQHKAIAGSQSKMSIEKIKNLLNLIIASQRECDNHEFSAYLTKTILVTFLYHKANSQQDITIYLTELNRLNTITQNGAPSEESNEENQLNTIYQLCENINYSHEQQKKQYEKELAQALENNYHHVLLDLMIKNYGLPFVLQSRYVYEHKDNVGKSDKPNCVESSLVNMLNIILHDATSNTFSFSLLPKSLQPHPSLQAYYAMQNFRTEQALTAKVGQAFMNLVSGLDGLEYKSGNFELPAKATPTNFIPLMNHLFGCQATSFTELSNCFSDENRTIEFSLNESAKQIEISIQPAGATAELLIFDFSKDFHAELHADRFKKAKNNDDSALSAFAEFAYSSLNKYPTLLPVLTYITGNEEYRMRLVYQDLSKNNSTEKNVQIIQHYMIHCFPKDSEEAYDLLAKMMLLNLLQQRNIEKYARHLCQQFKQIICFAAKRNNNSVLAFALSAEANPNICDSSGNSPLHDATITGNLDNMKLLIDANADINVKDSHHHTPIYYAVSLENTKALHVLLDAGANIHHLTGEGLTLLHLAALNGKVKMISALIDKGAQPNATSSLTQSTPLHYAAQRGYTNSVISLLDAKAKPNCIDKNGVTPLIHASNQIESDHLVSLLLKAGANPNITDKYQRTALLVAVIAKNTDVCRLLLEYKAEPNVTDKYNKSPLFYAIQNKSSEQVKCLLDAGANPAIVDDNNLSLINHAEYLQLPEIVEMLKQAKIASAEHNTQFKRI